MTASAQSTELPRPRRSARQARRRAFFSAAIRLLATTAIALSSILAVMMVTQNQAGFQFDFRGDLYGAGHAILHGSSPYQTKTLAGEAAVIRDGRTFAPQASPRWPMPVLVAAAPLSLLPFKLAGWIFLLLSLGGVIAALRLFGVRDWRCFVVACLSWPVMWGVWLGNISPLLLLVAALAWRWRSRAGLLGAAVASALLAKLILWTLVVWLVITRRFRALLMAVAVAAAACVIAWSLIGFAGLAGYPHLLRAVAYIGQGRGSSLVTLLMSVGIPAGLARTVAMVCGGVLLGAAWLLPRTGQDGERRAFGLTVMAALIMTPVVWAHYFVLLLAPIALLSPQLSWMWFLPMLAVLNPAPTAHPAVWANLAILVSEVVIIGRLCSPLLPDTLELSKRFPGRSGVVPRGIHADPGSFDRGAPSTFI